jgi:hypothetical protein
LSISKSGKNLIHTCHQASIKVFIVFILKSSHGVFNSYFEITSFGFKENAISTFFEVFKDKMFFILMLLVLISIFTLSKESKKGINSLVKFVRLSVQRLSE